MKIMAITAYDHEDLGSNAHSYDEEKSVSISTTSVNIDYADRHCPPAACMEFAQTGNNKNENPSVSSRGWNEEDAVRSKVTSSDETDEKCGVLAAVDGQRLSRQHRLNLIFCLLAWACTACTHTMMVGTNNLAVLSIGAAMEISTLPLGAYFFGAFFASCLLAPWVFRWGRRIGFVTGIALGLCGAVLGCVSILIESVVIFMLANIFYGASTGLGFGLRFAAVEVVPPFFAAKAVALVVSGGCLAAFLGPELAGVTIETFGEDNQYLGTLMVTGVFNVLNLFFILLIKFPNTRLNEKGAEARSVSQLCRLLCTRSFLVAALVTSISWAAMSMPMSMFRVTMAQLGFSGRQSLITLEIHFLGMFVTGFASGPFISRWGYRAAAYVGTLTLAISEIILLLVKPSSNEDGLAAWLIGMSILAISWNFGFTGATLWLTEVYRDSLQCYRDWVQAANDSIMFAFAGVFIFSSSYISEATGSGLRGWQTVVSTSLVLVMVMAAVLYWNKQKEGEEERARRAIEAFFGLRPGDLEDTESSDLTTSSPDIENQQLED